MSLDTLHAADRAFSEGNNKLGLMRLREFCTTDAVSPANWNRLAVVEEQIGDWANAGHAHHQCIKSAPHFASSYLYAGYWLQQSDKTDAAAAAYSLAQELDPYSLSTQAKQSEFARIRGQAGNQLMRQFLTEQHQQLFGDEDSIKRIKNAIWTRTHNLGFDYQRDDFSPELFYIPELRQQAFYADEDFSWSKSLQQNSALISTELQNALTEKITKQSIRPYLPEHSVAQGPLLDLAGSDEWSALDLFKDGVLNQEVAALFPKTTELLDSVATYALEQDPFEVFFSLLKPGQEIAPHYGQSNHSLTAHLALEVPANCHLIVAHQQRQWQQGKLLVFDDSFLHSAHNLSQQLRVVLIFSVWHPDLTKIERQAIQLSFSTRSSWMQQRVAKLDQLLSAAK